MASAHASRGDTVVGTSVAFLVAAIALVITRVLTRILIVRDFGPEDWTILVAAIFALGMAICMGEQVRYGLGRHFETLSMETYQNSLKPFWASIWLYYLSLTFTKVSILFQYYRIIIYERTRLAIWIMMGIVVCYGIATFFDSLFICVPISDFWSANRQKANSSCVNENSVWYSNAGINIALDVAIVVLPMPAVKGLAISRGRKLGVMILFALGGFVTVTSIVRLYSLHQVANSDDVTWDNIGAAVWSCVEVDVGIMCACLPATRPLYSCLTGRRTTNSASHYRLPEEGSSNEMPLSPTNPINLRTPPSAHHSSTHSSHEARLGEDELPLSPVENKSSFLVSATRSERT